MRASSSMFCQSFKRSFITCAGIGLVLSSLSGCSMMNGLFGKQDHKAEPYTKKSMQISTTQSAQEAAQKYPKKVGQQVCRDLQNKLWGDFVMVGRVGAIGENYLMRVDLLRVQLKGQRKITQRGFAKTRWAMQNQWYSCKDPV